jgi:hypothetical protein
MSAVQKNLDLEKSLDRQLLEQGAYDLGYKVVPRWVIDCVEEVLAEPEETKR